MSSFWFIFIKARKISMEHSGNSVSSFDGKWHFFNDEMVEGYLPQFILIVHFGIPIFISLAYQAF
jgi:hypothetical protein